MPVDEKKGIICEQEQQAGTLGEKRDEKSEGEGISGAGAGAVSSHLIPLQSDDTDSRRNEKSSSKKTPSKKSAAISTPPRTTSSKPKRPPRP